MKINIEKNLVEFNDSTIHLNVFIPATKPTYQAFDF